MMKKLTLLLVLLGLWAGIAQAEMAATPSGLRYEDQTVGTGPLATKGSKAEVHYTGWLDRDGQKWRKFDSSKDIKQPFTFKLGVGEVIKGWDEGVEGMKVGGVRTLYIPAALGYGSRGAGRAIPPDAPLIFVVELLSVNGKGNEKPWGEF